LSVGSHYFTWKKIKLDDLILSRKTPWFWLPEILFFGVAGIVMVLFCVTVCSFFKTGYSFKNENFYNMVYSCCMST
jgi:hypothetical protein